jgi:hypothetical protein
MVAVRQNGRVKIGKETADIKQLVKKAPAANQRRQKSDIVSLVRPWPR